MKNNRYLLLGLCLFCVVASFVAFTVTMMSWKPFLTLTRMRVMLSVAFVSGALLALSVTYFICFLKSWDRLA